jgi:hypothetical protein
MKPLTWTALGRATRETAATAERARYKLGNFISKFALADIHKNKRHQFLTVALESWMSILNGWWWLNWG